MESRNLTYDNIEIGFNNGIPLWLYGLMYSYQPISQ